MSKRVRSSKYDKYYDINKAAQKYIFVLQPLELHFSSLKTKKLWRSISGLSLALIEKRTLIWSHKNIHTSPCQGEVFAKRLARGHFLWLVISCSNAEGAWVLPPWTTFAFWKATLTISRSKVQQYVSFYDIYPCDNKS